MEFRSREWIRRWASREGQKRGRAGGWKGGEGGREGTRGHGRHEGAGGRGDVSLTQQTCGRQEMGASVGEVLDCTFYCTFFLADVLPELAAGCGQPSQCESQGWATFFPLQPAPGSLCASQAQYALFTRSVHTLVCRGSSPLTPSWWSPAARRRPHSRRALRRPCMPSSRA